MHAILTALLAATTIHAAPCPSEPRPACAIGETREVWIAPGTPSRRYVLHHELGHVFDAAYMDDGARNRFGTLTRDPRPWGDPGAAMDGYAEPPRERFAEAFTVCARPPRRRVFDYSLGRHSWHLRDAPAYGYDPSPRVYRAVCRLIRHAFRR